MDPARAALQWSAQLSVHTTPRSRHLPGDKIILPPSALEQLLSASARAVTVSSEPVPTYDPWNPRDHLQSQKALEERQQQGLPHPLTFRLVNPGSGKVIYAGIQEFSAEDDSVIVSDFVRSSLGLVSGKEGQENNGEEASVDQHITVHHVILPKGTYVKLRPLEAGYDAEDWKALLEQHMRYNFTTLSKGEVLEVQGEVKHGKRGDMYSFLVDEFKPDVDGICVVDTDLEVDIEPLNEDQAKETIKRIAENAKRGTQGGGSSGGGDIDLFRESSGQVMPGEYVDYQLPSWPRDQVVEFVAETPSGAPTVDLLVSPLSNRQRIRPRMEDFVFADWEDRPRKRVRLQPSNVELEDAEALYVSIYSHGLPDAPTATTRSPVQFTLSVRVGEHENLPTAEDDTPPNAGDVRCKNCRQWVPQRTLMLHENFCLRNNVLCPQGCGQVFQKRSQAFEDHWHCYHDTMYGNNEASKTKHDHLYHPAEPLPCSRCSTQQTFSSVPLLAQHHVSTCPAKIILCRFCHLAVPQEGDADEPNAEALLSGLTVHELQDGSRTTECHLCGKITRMRDMDTHMKHHDLQRKSRARPRMCRNANCGNTLDGASHAGSTRVGRDTGNDIGLCSACYGPFYVSMYDPDGKALKRRIERKYLQQLMTGCGKAWCANDFCRTGRKNAGKPEEGTSAKTALPMAKPFVDKAVIDQGSPLHLCVEEANQRRKDGAAMLHAELQQMLGGRAYSLPWCVAAVEAEQGALDKARAWLENYAPRMNEERS